MRLATPGQALAALTAIVALGCPAAPATEPVPARASPVMLFRGYAMAACLAQAFPAIAPDANAAAGGYLELGDAPVEAYTAASKLAAEFVAKSYPSIRNANLGVMKCVDLARSRELDALVAQYYPRQRRR